MQGGCNVGSNEITQFKSECIRNDEDFAHTEDATPNNCAGCIHHDCSHLNIRLLEERQAELKVRSEDYSVPLGVRLGCKKECEVLDQVIASELRLEQNNRKRLHKMTGDFTQLMLGQSEEGASL